MTTTVWIYVDGAASSLKLGRPGAVFGTFGVGPDRALGWGAGGPRLST